MNLRQLRLEEVSFSQFVGKSEVAVAVYWNGETGFANWYTKSEEAFESEEAFTASELYQELKSKAFQDLQRTLEHRLKVVAPLIQGVEEVQPIPEPELKSRWKDGPRVWELVDITTMGEELYYHLKLISGRHPHSERVVDDLWFRGKKLEVQ